MAATNFTPIQLYFSTTASAVPLAANLAQGELAINITDGKLYYEDNAGAVQVIATKGAGTIGGSTTQIQYNNAGALAGNAAMVFNNSTNVTTLTTLNLTNALGAIYGGTAQSTYAQGDFLYASASNTLAKLGIGANTYILTSTGSVPQWVAPSSIAVLTATNLAGGLAGSVPYQSALDTTTFLAIGAANRVMTSTGTAPQWVTSLTGLTGVSSSSITNTSLTSGRVVVSTTAGLQADDADLTFDGTTLSAGGFSTVGLSTLVKTVKIGDSSFNGVAVFAAATPAKLYMGTGTVTDVTSAISATNAIGAIASLGITPIAATNTSVTYTNAATLYIAGAPSAGTNITLTNPYSLYVAAGAAYFGGAVTVAGSLSLAAVTVTSLTDSGLTSGRVTYATTAGLLTDSANLLYSGTDLTVYGITVGRGAGAVATNTAVGTSALTTNSTGATNVAVGYQSGEFITTGSDNVSIGVNALRSTAITGTGSNNTAIGRDALVSNTTTSNNTAVGYQAGYTLSAVANQTFLGYQAGYSRSTGNDNYSTVMVGNLAGYSTSTGIDNTYVGGYAARYQTGSTNTALGGGAFYGASGTSTGSSNTAIGYTALFSNTTASNNTAVGYQSGYNNTTGANNVYLGFTSAYYQQTGGNNTAVGYQAFQGNSTPANNTGSNNSAFGQNALLVNSSGANNTAIGKDSLQANTTASNNTAVGYQAGYTNVAGTRLTAVGYFAAKSSTGDYNTHVGAFSGQLSTGSYNAYFGDATCTNNASSGSYNSALGQAALANLTSGAYNTAVGNAALVSNTTASNNTAVGYQAGYSNTTAQYSTFVGYQAGLNSNRTVDVSGFNTFVGYRSGENVSTGQVNVFIGSRAGTSGASRITGTANTVVGDFAGNTLEGAANTNAFFGQNSGYAITTGSKNTIIGSYGGNQGGLDIRTASNYIVLSDGDGNPRAVQNGTNGTWAFQIGTAVTSTSGTTGTLALLGTADIVDLSSVPGLFQVSVRNSDGGINWRNSSQVFFNGVSSSSIVTSDSANVTVTMSGTNIRLTNTSATSIALYYAILRLL